MKLNIVAVIAVTLFILFVPRSVMAMDAMQCFPHVKNVTIDGVRYFEVTRVDRKECDLYLLAKSFPQLGEDGKALPIQQQLRSIKAANDKSMEGKRGVRPVHSHCVPESKPWPDQTQTEREMCPAQMVNYYPVTNVILVPKVPQLSKSEQISQLSESACKAMSEVRNPGDSVKRALKECQKHFEGIAIAPLTVSPLKQELQEAKSELTVLSQENSKQVNALKATDAKLAGLATAKRGWSITAVVFMLAFGLTLVTAVSYRRKQNKLQDLANIREHEMEARVAEKLEERVGGPSREDHEAVLRELDEVRGRLQKATNGKTELSQQIVGLHEQHQKDAVKRQSEIDSAQEQVAVMVAKRDELGRKLAAREEELQRERELRRSLAEEASANQRTLDKLGIQLTHLLEAELGVRLEHLDKLRNAIKLAADGMAELDKRRRECLAQGEDRKAEFFAAKIDALRDVLAILKKESDERGAAVEVLRQNDPGVTDSQTFVNVLIHDAGSRTDGMALATQANLMLGKLQDNLSGANNGILDELARARAENAELKELWSKFVTGLSKAVGLDLKALVGMEPEDQARQLALKTGELKARKLTQSDLQEQVETLRAQCDDLRAHNASLRKAMEDDHGRQAIASYEYQVVMAEVRLTQKERELGRVQVEVEKARSDKERLQVALRDRDNGWLALEAPELMVMPTQRLMYHLQQCMVAIYRQPEGKSQAEVVVGSDEELGALYRFLHIPLVSDQGHKLPPELTATMGPLMVMHVADRICRREEKSVEAEVISVTPTMRPPMSGNPADLRKQTMDGLGAVPERKHTVPYPPKTPDIALSDEGKGSAH